MGIADFCAVFCAGTVVASNRDAVGSVALWQYACRGGVGRLVGTDFVSFAFGFCVGYDFGSCGLAQSNLVGASHRRA